MRIQVAGASIAVHERGSGTPLLLVHGFPFSSWMWEPVAARLASSGRRCVLPDLRGFGASTGTAADMSTHASDLVAVLDAMGLRDPLPWVGFSMGGYVVLEAMRRTPGRIGALGLVDTRAAPDDAAGKAGRTKTAESVEREGSVVVADAMRPKLFAKSTGEDLRAAVRAQMTAAAPAAVAAALRAMGDRPDSVPTLAAVHVPTVVVVGDEDAITPPADSKALVAGIPGSKLVVVAGAGHLSPMEKPDAVATALATLGARGAPA